MNESKKKELDVRKDKYLIRYTRCVAITFFTAFAVMIAMAVTNIALSTNKELDIGLDSFQKIDDYLKVTSGKKFDASRIDTYELNEYGGVSVFYKLPSEMGRDQSIVFRSKNSYVEAILDGQYIYSTDSSGGPFLNGTPGVRWNFISVDEKDAGKTIEIRFKLAYHDGRSTVDSFYEGDSAAIVISIVKNMRKELIACMFILLIGVVYLITNIVMNVNQRIKDFSLFYLSIFSIISSLWALLETGIIQLFVDNPEPLQMISNMMLILGGVPLFLYMESVYGVFKYKIVRISCMFTTVYTMFAALSHFTGLWDVHQTLNGAIANYMFVIFTIVGCLFREGIVNHSFCKKGRYYMEYLMQQVGLVTLAACLLADVYRYARWNPIDGARYTRAGISIFSILLGAGTIFRLLKLVEQGRKAELISKLAYLDGLTETGNRTAYKERLEQLAKSDEEVGCCFVMLDINNLKLVNDTFGHQRGDKLIRQATGIINNSFGLEGEVYRIGGDEFVVLIVNDDPLSSYEELLPVFEKLIFDKNKGKRWEEEISIAHGKSYCDNLSRYGLKSAEQEADSKMYKNKVKMKSDRMIQFE